MTQKRIRLTDELQEARLWVCTESICADSKSKWSQNCPRFFRANDGGEHGFERNGVATSKTTEKHLIETNAAD